MSATITIAAIGGVTGIISASSGGSGGGGSSGSSGGGTSLTVQVKVDLDQAFAALGKLGFRGTYSVTNGSPSKDADCAASAGGEVKRFLTQHHCKDYASAITTTHGQGIATRIVITWVVLSSGQLASQYETKADKLGDGNPPGEPRATFNGHCYDSGRNDATVWTEQVQPTGLVTVDQAILRSAAPTKPSSNYLKQHCTE